MYDVSSYHDIKVGDTVRIFDFTHRDLTGDKACYHEGVVSKIAPWKGCNAPCLHFHVIIEKRIWHGIESALKPEWMFPTVENPYVAKAN